jgi:hypothetical protein
MPNDQLVHPWFITNAGRRGLMIAVPQKPGQYVRTVRTADPQGNWLWHLYADDADPRFAKKTPAQLDSEFGGGVDHAVLNNENPFAERIPAGTRVPDGPGLADDKDRQTDA